MVDPTKQVALLDANVLFPAPVRDLLLSMAEVGLFYPKWTDAIQKEWIRSLLNKRPDLLRKSLVAATKAMNSAFPDANVLEYSQLHEGIVLPDPNDLHVVIAAIHGFADLIITFNIKDFPKDVLNKFQLEAKHPDDFAANLINLRPHECYTAFYNQLKRLKNPPLEPDQLVDIFKKCGLPKSAGLLRDFIR